MKALITTDGSDESYDAIERYARFHPSGITEHVVLTVDEFQAYGIIDSVDQAEMDRLQRERARKILDRAQNILEGHGLIGSFVQRAGQAADTILRTAEEVSVDLIVIGARGASAVTRVLLGSTSDAVVSHAKPSVWVVRPDQSHPDLSQAHVTVAYDGSDVSKHAIEYLRRLQLPATAKISLLSLVRRPENLPDEVVYDPKQLEDSQKELESLRAALVADTSANVEVVVAESRHLAHAIVEFAGRHHSALVVVGDKGRSAIARFFLGSVSRSVLHHAPCSVLVVKRRS